MLLAVIASTDQYASQLNYLTFADLDFKAGRIMDIKTFVMILLWKLLYTL